jgi:thioredoxin reductase
MTTASPKRCDIAVIGGGPAGLAAALWAARYRRHVVMIDAGEQRNRWTRAAHGYLGLEGVAPSALLEAAREDLHRYPETEMITDRRVVSVVTTADGFMVECDDHTKVVALRLVIATGIRDIFPDIDGFERFYGTSIFTCPSCDGYEAQGRRIVVMGPMEQTASFALGLLDWASSITVLVETAHPHAHALADSGIATVVGVARRMTGDGAQLSCVELESGEAIACDMVFCTLEHEQQSTLARDLGCEISPDGCVLVDEQCRTSVEHVYAAGDSTPGPHLVQVAASKGAVAGIAAAMSLRGEYGSGTSSRPAPDPERVLPD